MAKQVHPSNLPSQGLSLYWYVRLPWNRSCQLLPELRAPPMMVFPECDAVMVESRQFKLFFDPSVVSMDATLEQGRTDGSRQPTACMSRAVLEVEGC